MWIVDPVTGVSQWVFFRLPNILFSSYSTNLRQDIFVA